MARNTTTTRTLVITAGPAAYGPGADWFVGERTTEDGVRFDEPITCGGTTRGPRNPETASAWARWVQTQVKAPFGRGSRICWTHAEVRVDGYDARSGVRIVVPVTVPVR